MSACSVETIEQLTQALLERDGDVRLRVERAVRDDVAPALLAKANQLAAAGEPVAVVCADVVAQQRFCAQLPAYPALDVACVVTMRDFALDFMRDERVSALLERDARVLDENEHDVLLEDMKVSGIKPRRLREMLKFFYKSMSEYANEEPRWLVNTEEQTVWAILTENLEARRAWLPHELSAAAYRGLVDANIEHVPLSIVVDDFGTLSRASQRLLTYAATGTLVVVGSACATANTEEPYPCPDGFAALVDSFETVTLASGHVAAQASFEGYADPGEEFAFTADAVAQRLSDGVAASDVLVAVPNKTWAVQLACALGQRGVRTHVCVGDAKVKGDPRDGARNGQLKLAAFLRLVIDPEDFTALRSWVGLGDWLLRSDAFLELMAFARENDLSAREAMRQLRTMADAERPSKIFGKFDAPLDELDDLLVACASIGCVQATELFAQHGMPLDEGQVALLGDDPEHADLERLAHEAFVRPTAAVPADAVTIASFGQCHGRFARTMFVTGLVNGFLPKIDAMEDKYTIDHRRTALARDRALFDDVVSTASDEVVCSYFTHDRLENTGLLDMQAARVYVKGDTRYAAIQPSEFIPSV